VAALTAVLAVLVLTGADPWSGRPGPVVIFWLVLLAMLMVAEEAIGNRRLALAALLTAASCSPS
jgi:uncharacterized membrane protein YhhN